MKAILMAMKKRHNDNIESGLKTSELRTRPPKLKPPFKVYTLETLSSGGCGKVTNEWICKDMTEWRICMGVPAHLPKRACVTVAEIRAYSGKDFKNITEMQISDLVVYDQPKDLSEFSVPCKVSCERCKNPQYFDNACTENGSRKIKRVPQSWCLVNEL